MTALRRVHDNWLLIGFALVLLSPSAAIRAGLLPFDMRFEALLAISSLCIGLTFLAGYSAVELGLHGPWVSRHWLGCGVATLCIAAALYLESLYFSIDRPQPDWLRFAPFYVLISSPCQELVCRAIPRLIADRLHIGGGRYMLFSASIFSLMHVAYGDPLLLANTFVVGLIWAAAYELTRNIWPVAASHAAIGSLAFWLGIA